MKPSVTFLTRPPSVCGVQRWLEDTVAGIQEFDCRAQATASDCETPEEPTDLVVAPLTIFSSRRFLSKYSGRVITVVHGGGARQQGVLDAASEKASLFVAPSRFCLRFLKGVSKPIRVVHCGIDKARLSTSTSRNQLRDDLGFGEADVVVGHLGRLSPEKHVNILIQAVDRLPLRFKGLIVGPDAEIQAEHPRVTYLPAVERVGDVLACMDVVVGLCPHESFWMVGMEAAILGVPLVSVGSGILGDIADSHGVLWQVIRDGQNPRNIAEAVLHCSENQAAVEPQVGYLREIAATLTVEASIWGWTRVLWEALAS